ncbi:transcription regulator HTH, apses-type DNA-binding domain-containing protein, partial [Fimicolochytrium jonesii]|uniref:transcription regulator HTH, apses-type DNA-binding domain-containing protein n=1 Tax=Fimicolochytrium jonesii TaxID=1396493 RepID=UPI0022FE0626
MPQALPNGAIRAASYSGVRVYETMCRGIPVMRRMGDAYINATQILRAAGLPKPQRTKILERDVTGGVHEKVQGGYAGFQGTWVPLGSARKIAAIHGVDRELDPLFSY